MTADFRRFHRLPKKLDWVTGFILHIKQLILYCDINTNANRRAALNPTAFQNINQQRTTNVTILGLYLIHFHRTVLSILPNSTLFYIVRQEIRAILFATP